jgi:hypothetical protein
MLRLLIQKSLAVVLLLPIGWFVYRFPLLRPELALFYGSYLLLLHRYPRAWLLVVPALLPLLCLAPWSGRLFFDEFDALVLTTLAGILLVGQRAPVRVGWPPLRVLLLLSLFLLLFIFGVLRGLWPPPIAGPQQYSELLQPAQQPAQRQGLLVGVAAGVAVALAERF